MEYRRTRLLVTVVAAAMSLIGTGCDPEPPASSVSIPTTRAGYVDDTFACLSRPGPLVEIRGSQEYDAYKDRSFADNTRFDADASLWHTQQVPEYRTAYPINIGGGQNGCWAGGIVLGTSDENARWGELYAKFENSGGKIRRQNSAAIIWKEARDFLLDGLRAHNTWDAIRIGPKSNNFTIRNVWVTRNRDDCVENDSLQQGLIDDSLFDGCFVAFSARTSPNSDRDGSDNLWTIQDSLIRLEPMPGAHNEGPRPQQPGHKAWFKWKPGKGPKVALYNNVFMAEQPSNLADRLAGIPPLDRNGQPLVEIVDCKNNVMVWLGEGEYPYHLHDCFTVTKDRSVWDRAKQDWIDRHPKVPRLPEDPKPAASQEAARGRSIATCARQGAADNRRASRVWLLVSLAAAPDA